MAIKHAAAAIATCSCIAGAAEPPAKIALTGARIVTVSGEDIEAGTVLIENGRITAVGAGVELPYDAMEVELGGKWIMPGLVNVHSWGGLDVPNESLPVTPFLDVYDAIDPSRLYFEDALRDGVTAVHVIVANQCVIGGVSRVVRPIGLTPDEMTIRPDVAMKLAVSPRRGWDRMMQLAAMREAFAELDDSLGKLAEKKYEDSLKKKGEKLTVGPKEARERGKPLIDDKDYDDKQRNLVRLRRGDLAAFVYCENATDVGPALKLAEDQGFKDRTTLVLGPEAYKAAAELRRAQRPVVLDDSLYYRETDPITGEISETFVPRVIFDAGLKFAVTPSPNSSYAERYLTYQAAQCVRNGVPRKEAIRAITLTPAEMLGLGDRLGSIEVGKDGSIVVFSGDPLDFNSWVEQVYIDGILAYDRSKDHRLERLFKLGSQPPAESEDETPPPDGGGAEPEDGAPAAEGDDGDASAPPAPPPPPSPSPAPGDGR